MTTVPYDLILIFVAILCGAVSAGYFYRSADIFIDMLKKPLHLISSGMMLMTFGVLLAAFISYAAKLGVVAYMFGLPIQVLFYALYIVGSVMILVGARQFTNKPNR